MPKIKAKIKIYFLNNYEEFTKFCIELPEKAKNVYFFFTGAKKENGRSWCIYCQMGNLLQLKHRPFILVQN